MGALHYDRRLADFVQLVIANVGSFGGLCREMDCSAHSSRVCTSTFSAYSAWPAASWPRLQALLSQSCMILTRASQRLSDPS